MKTQTVVIVLAVVAVLWFLMRERGVTMMDLRAGRPFSNRPSLGPSDPQVRAGTLRGMWNVR